MQQSQTISVDIANHVTSLIMNNAVNSSKDDKAMIAEAKQAIGANEKFSFDILVRMIGLCERGSEKVDSAIKAKPDWESAFLKLYGLATPYARSKAVCILEETKDGSRADHSELNLKECAIQLQSIKNEVVGYRKNTPSVMVRCGFERIEEESTIKKLEEHGEKPCKRKSFKPDEMRTESMID